MSPVSIDTPRPAAKPAQTAPPADAIPTVPLAQPVESAEEGSLTVDGDPDADWKNLPLEFAKEGEQESDTGLDLDKPNH